MPIDLSIIGVETEPIERTWTEDSTLLYALAVGAGQTDQTKELSFTTENTAGVQLQALPTMASVLSQGRWPSLGEVDMRRFLHVREQLEIHSPLPTSGRLRTSASIVDIYDKGSAAALVAESKAFDAESGAPLATTRRWVFLGGEGGFGGERGPSEEWAAPDRKPDLLVECRTRPEQALLYRLTGDRVRLHSDPSFATAAGFEKPILHGMCTYGYAARSLITGLCDEDASRIAALDARFASPVVPGDVLELKAWLDGDSILFMMTCGDRIVLDRGTARIK